MALSGVLREDRTGREVEYELEGAFWRRLFDLPKDIRWINWGGDAPAKSMRFFATAKSAQPLRRPVRAARKASLRFFSRTRSPCLTAAAARRSLDPGEEAGRHRGRIPTHGSPAVQYAAPAG